MAKKRSLNLTTMIGVVLAIATFGFVLVFLSGFDSGVTVYVASEDIAPNRQITPNMISAKTVDQESVPPGAITNTAAIVGAYTVDRIYRGEAFTSSRLATDNETGTGLLINQMPPDARLMSVEANVAVALAGRIRPGDYVDVIAVFEQLDGVQIDPVTQLPVQTEGTSMPVGAYAQTLIQKAFVADVNLPSDALSQAASQSTQGDRIGVSRNPAETSNPVVPGIYTLIVTPQQAQMLALAVATGDLYLVLAPGPDALEYEAVPTQSDDIVASGGVGPRPWIDGVSPTTTAGNATTTTTTPRGPATGGSTTTPTPTPPGGAPTTTTTRPPVGGLGDGGSIDLNK